MIEVIANSKIKLLAQSMMMKEKEAITEGLSDISKYAEGQIEDSNHLERKLNARHLRMIAIGKKPNSVD